LEVGSQREGGRAVQKKKILPLDRAIKKGFDKRGTQLVRRVGWRDYQKGKEGFIKAKRRTA